MFKFKTMVTGMILLVFCTSSLAYTPKITQHSHSIFESGHTHKKLPQRDYQRYQSERVNMHAEAVDENTDFAFKAGMTGGAVIGLTLLAAATFSCIYSILWLV